MIFSGERVPVPDMSLTSYVLQRAEHNAARVAAVDVAGENAHTYGELASAVRRAATGLHARGFRKGDVLAMLTPNVPEYPIAFHAAAVAGGTVMVLNPLDTTDELVGHLNDAGARFLVVLPSEAARAGELRARSTVEEIVVFGEADGATPFASLLASADAPPAVAIDPAQDVVALLHSSGTTGYPKGVMLTHRNMVANVLQTSRVAPLGEDEKVLAVPPFHHAFGLIMVLNASLLQGATLITMPRFDPEAYLKAIEQHRITRLYVVPTIAVLLAKSPLVDRYDLSSVREIVSGGAALDPEIAALVRQRLGCHIGQGYGLTEALVSFMQTGVPVAPGSVGRNAPNIECKIVDVTTGEELGPNRNGEILIRGPHRMKGYLNAEEAADEVIEADGFLRTGDLGHFNDAGELIIVDRIKELIKYKGQQVSPAELEAVVMAHPNVADAAVVGVPDEEASEVPKAFVVTRGPATPEEIMAFVAERVAPYKKIRQLEFIDEIPRTPVGKIERRSLVARERAA
ncbi:Acyl-CoA synthetase (AMP-forming)/AMP-acid ligase II [Saccharopolyspora antimicrobica]|uniref:Acyl-CoA synthetase (AMP-forming)/AMP-acid ligase II n=1 Tax=Saccharopolyspora antimicrobica TaxID=455193 RepID=A0A1I4VUW9_9PSEU|nr:AMP-binding protein [Saccharopolyspora antimicrobica]RKT87204.1 acyl-CoA synthetase (AMP-forming)/AMP-acid ligase II [Saccharopolyspora antimicrobica]SFN04817.1 Acyl-CoA synthetase (AMP-forming)/AMP-acid ligase II [Saccharopolyspora antimicrobica]